jgi:hypothetical protein
VPRESHKRKITRRAVFAARPSSVPLRMHDMRFATLDDEKSPSVANRGLPGSPSMPPLTFAGAPPRPAAHETTKAPGTRAVLDVAPLAARYSATYRVQTPLKGAWRASDHR